MVIASGPDGEGPHSWKFAATAKITRTLTENARRNAKAIERMRGPSARFACLGMTRVSVILYCRFNP
ncbi:MAG: hypothetical protein QOE26_1524 [Verrucomicrobiota bacterium]|jgi:hypothetical protein